MASVICLTCVLLMAALAVAQSRHDHEEEQCAVCAKIHDSRDLANSLRVNSATPLDSDFEFFPSYARAVVIPRAGQATPVSLKVRIDR
jgi:hypothetical protein